MKLTLTTPVSIPAKTGTEIHITRRVKRENDGAFVIAYVLKDAGGAVLQNSRLKITDSAEINKLMESKADDAAVLRACYEELAKINPGSIA